MGRSSGVEKEKVSHDAGVDESNKASASQLDGSNVAVATQVKRFPGRNFNQKSNRTCDLKRDAAEPELQATCLPLDDPLAEKMRLQKIIDERNVEIVEDLFRGYDQGKEEVCPQP